MATKDGSPVIAVMVPDVVVVCRGQDLSDPDQLPWQLSLAEPADEVRNQGSTWRAVDHSYMNLRTWKQVSSQVDRLFRKNEIETEWKAREEECRQNMERFAREQKAADQAWQERRPRYKTCIRGAATYRSACHR